MFNLIKKLCRPLSVSGREETIAGVIAEEIAPYADAVSLDALGNLTAFKGGSAPDGERKKIMFAAHADEIGFMVSFIEENGFIRFQTLGGINFASAAFTRVIFENGTRGVLVPETGVGAGDFRQEKFVVDIGAKNRKEAERKVAVGDTFAVESDVIRLSGRRIAGRPLDDRVGCAVLVEAAKRMSQSGKAPRNDIYFCFTVQEEVGCRGSKTAAYAVRPDIGIALDVTATGDTIGAKPMAVSLGGGAAVKIKDSSVVCDREVVKMMKELCEEGGIRYQTEVLAAGGTDTSSMQAAASGARAGCISIPCRYIHSSAETVDLDDVEACVCLTEAIALR